MAITAAQGGLLKMVLGGAGKLAAYGMQIGDMRRSKKRLEEAEKNLEEAEEMPVPQLGIQSQFQDSIADANRLTKSGEQLMTEGLTGSERSYITNMAATSSPYAKNNRFGYNDLMNRISNNQGMMQAGKLMSDTALEKKKTGASMMNQGIGLSAQLAGRIQDSKDAQFERDFSLYESIQTSAGEAVAASLENQQKARNAFAESMADMGQNSKGGDLSKMDGYEKLGNNWKNLGTLIQGLS